MSEHIVDISWTHAPSPLADNTYDRNHRVSFGNSQQVLASSAPDFKGDPAGVDPEQLLISALASCHMLTFLAIAELKGYAIKSYDDKARGFLEKGESGRFEVTLIQLKPQIVFSDDKEPDAEALKRMHASAHKNCFVANSIKTKVEIL